MLELQSGLVPVDERSSGFNCRTYLAGKFKDRPSPLLELNGVAIADTFAEAFPVFGTRLIITAATEQWAEIAARETCGFATSVIACDVEAGIDAPIPAAETPDGRPGIGVLLFAFSRKALTQAAINRVGQCVLTCPTTACYNGLPEAAHAQTVSIGGQLRYFGDGFQSSKQLGRRRFWRIPVMDGEFVCEDRFGAAEGVGGGNLILCAADGASALAAAEAAAEAIRQVSGVVLPFPGGIVRAGSKVGSRYKQLKASTNDAYCPTLAARTDSQLPEGTGAVYEIVIDGLTFASVRDAMHTGIHAACECDGLSMVTAGNYGGKLGPHHFPLRELL